MNQFIKKAITVKLTLMEEVLGMMPSNEEVFTEFIASKAPDAPTLEQEVEAFGVDETVEKGMTVFPKEDGVPFIWDYQLKGMFKDSMKLLRINKGTACGGLTNYKGKIDGALFIVDKDTGMPQRKVMYELSGELGTCERPLRAETMQGPRVALAKSETIPAGSTLTFTVGLTEPGMEKAVRECLDYGAFHGLGQWRNSGKGRFVWEEV